MKYLIVIGGATATGKTATAIELAKRFETGIISADSRQFFKEMSIGTAKPTPEELAAAPHFLIDNLSVADDYSVGDFERDALAILEQLFQEKDVAILVGGSGLYLRAVCEGMDSFPEITDTTRSIVETGFQEGGVEWLQSNLQLLDPEYFNKVDKQNPARLRRALEVCIQSGSPFSSFRKNEKTPRNFKPVFILLEMPRDLLYARINARVDQMLAQGLVSEARPLLPYREKSALKTVGYEELFDHFDGHISFEEAVDKIKQHSRNYAKRQSTWFKKHGDWHAFHPTQIEQMVAFIRAEMGQ